MSHQIIIVVIVLVFVISISVNDHFDSSKIIMACPLCYVPAATAVSTCGSSLLVSGDSPFAASRFVVPGIGGGFMLYLGATRWPRPRAQLCAAGGVLVMLGACFAGWQEWSRRSQQLTQQGMLDRSCEDDRPPD